MSDDAAEVKSKGPIDIWAVRRIPENSILTVEELYESTYSRETHPPEVLERLRQFAKEYKFELSKDSQEVYLMYYSSNNRHELMVTPGGFFKACRRTKMWLPGKTTYDVDGSGKLSATASCYVSARPGETPTIEVSSTAKMRDYYVRGSSALRGSDGWTVPDWRWQAMPEYRLMEVAEILAARKALGDLVAPYRTMEGIVEIAYDPFFKEGHRDLAEKTKAAEQARGQ